MMRLGELKPPKGIRAVPARGVVRWQVYSWWVLASVWSQYEDYSNKNMAISDAKGVVRAEKTYAFVVDAWSGEVIWLSWEPGE